jgi:phosphate transport system substrate-binding protein
MINTAGNTNWPIVGPTYILIPKNPSDPDRARRVLAFFDWAFRNGSPAADQLHYIMLPDAVRNQIRQRWSQVQSGGQPVYSAGR